jgi:Transposase DDE domain
LVIVSSLIELPVDLLALIYRQRYSVELFFRFFKHLLGMRHLLSRRPNGVEIQVHCAVIACLLINLQTGRKPDKRMMETISWYLMGLMDEQQALEELTKPDNRGIKLRAKEEIWKKLGM